MASKTYGVPQAAMQCVLLLVITILVTVLYEGAGAPNLAATSISMLPCTEGERNCTVIGNNSNGDSEAAEYAFAFRGLHNLAGQSTEYLRSEPSNHRLFSSVGGPYLVLCSQIVATAFFLGYISQVDRICLLTWIYC